LVHALQLQLSLTPLAVGTVSIVGIAYNLKARSNEYDDENDEVDVGLLQRRDRKYPYLVMSMAFRRMLGERCC
jgi:hypothetical protein